MLTHHSRNHHERNSPGYSGAWYTPILGWDFIFRISFKFWIVTLNRPFKPGAGAYKYRYYLKNYLLGAHHNSKHIKAKWLTTVLGFYKKTIFKKKNQMRNSDSNFFLFKFFFQNYKLLATTRPRVSGISILWPFKAGYISRSWGATMNEIISQSI